ncbi:MAG: PASTA domain-containing protein [Synergistaceae bacterium]|nr:PASTA domain-containing protein [Synergistaceae bacterium]
MNRLFSWGIFIAVLVLAGSGFIAVKMVFGPNDEAAAPSLIGVSAVEATNMLQAAGLTARIDQVDSNYAEGTVIAQSVAPGEKTTKGKIVTLKVSRGGALVKIPDVRSKEFPEAAKELEDVGLKVGAVVRVSDQLRQPNTVIAQNPAAPAMVMNNRMVELLVSEGSAGRADTVQVPDVRGQTGQNARETLEQNDLVVGRILSIATARVPEGTVEKTEPRAGARVPTGRAVNLYMAKVPEPAPRPAEPTPRPQPAEPAQPDAPTLSATSNSGGDTAGMARAIPTWNPNQPAQPVQRTQPPSQTGQEPRRTITIPPAAAAPPSDKLARIRYQIPPLARTLSLNIVMADQHGTRVLREQQVSGGEYISMDAPYSGNALITVKLGEQLVWQEKYN